VLPSGRIFGFNLKIMLAILISSLLLKTVGKEKIFENRGFIAASALFFGFLVLSITVGYLNGFYETVLKEAYLYLGLYFTFAMLYLAYKNVILNVSLFFKTILFTSIAFYVIKLLLILCLYLKIFSQEALFAFIHSVFSANVMQNYSATEFFRLNFVFDLFSVFIVVYLREICQIAFHERSRSFASVYLILSVASIYFSYSRYIWAVLLLLGFMRMAFSIPPGRYRSVFVACAAAVILYAATTSPVRTRFCGLATKGSDDIRNIQAHVLIDDFKLRPLFGWGMGGFDRNYVRTSSAPFSYELEILAFFSKFGIIGALCPVLLLLSYAKLIYNRKAIFVLFSFFVALSYGFFNPYIVNTSFALLMFMLYLLCEVGAARV